MSVVGIVFFVLMVPGLSTVHLDDKDWHIVFRIASDVSFPDSSDLWRSNDFIVSLNENIAGAKSTSGSFPGHFKSSWISEWQSLGVIQVKVALYAEDGEELIAFTFDGRDQGKGSWFSSVNLQEISPYINITRAVGDTFYLTGFEDDVADGTNKIIIQASSSIATEECRDIGLLRAVGEDNRCDYGKLGFPLPSFIYSRKPTSAKWPAWIQDDDVECYIDSKGRDYRGFVSETVSGKTCQSWTVDEPHDHDRGEENYPEAGLGDHNFCRNPDGETGPWCYTTDPNVRWERCDVGARKRGCGGRFFNCEILGGTSWKYFNQSCYRYHNTREDLVKAEARCKSRHPNGHVAVPNSLTELEYIRNFTTRSTIWLGCRDKDANGRWTCSDHNEVNQHVYYQDDGSSEGFWYWDEEAGEPGDSTEHCVASSGDLGRFHDWNCNNTNARHPSVCEVPILFLDTKYIGCFVDNEDRIFQGGLLRSELMTLQLCFDFCTSRGMTYAGLEYMEECFCGSGQVNLAEHGPNNDDECKSKCAGDKTQICGGGWRLSVYDITRDDEIGFGNALAIFVKLKPSPVVSNCPEDITVSSAIGHDADDTNGTVVSWTEPLVELDPTEVVTTHTHKPGSIFPDGLTEVTYTFVQKVTRNSTTCSFFVNVLEQTALSRQTARNAAISLGMILLIIIVVCVVVLIFCILRLRREKDHQENEDMPDNRHSNVYTSPGGPTSTQTENGGASAPRYEENDLTFTKNNIKTANLKPGVTIQREPSTMSAAYLVPVGPGSSSGSPNGKMIEEDTYEELAEREKSVRVPPTAPRYKNNKVALENKPMAHLGIETTLKRDSSVISAAYLVPVGAGLGTDAQKGIDEDTYEELGERDPPAPYAGLNLKGQDEFIYEEPQITEQDDYINLP